MITRNWHLIDASNKTLGRLSSEIAKLLMGKHKANYLPNLDSGDFVVVINSDQVKLTGAKELQKVYHRHSGIPGGHKEETAGHLLSRNSRKVVEHAVAGMLPKNKLQALRLRRLKIYQNAEHPHINHFKQKEN